MIARDSATPASAAGSSSMRASCRATRTTSIIDSPAEPRVTASLLVMSRSNTRECPAVLGSRAIVSGIPDNGGGRLSSVPAAENVLRLLTYLAAHRRPVAASAVARDLGLPRSSVYHLLAVASERGFVVHLPAERRYALGPAAFELSGGYASQQPLARLGRPLLAQLVDRLRESGHLAVLHGADVLYLVEERAPRRPSLVSDVGVRLPAHLTASGRAMLAALSPAQRRAVVTLPLVVRHGEPMTPAQLRGLLTAVRREGYAVEDGEVTPGLASVGVAVTDSHGWPAAALAVTFPSDTNVDLDRASIV